MVAALAAVVLGQRMCMPPVPEEINALPAGTVIQGVGSTTLPITTQSELCLRMTRQGYALIHCFWFNEAVRSFRDAVKADPECAAAWAGLYISLTLPWHTPTSMKAEADYAIQQAVRHAEKSAPVVQGMIVALRMRSYHRDSRGTDYERLMQKLIDEHPGELEPRLIWACQRVQACMAEGYDKQGNLVGEMKLVLELIAPVLIKDPNNPAALHYRIHALEGTDPAAALDAARRLGRSAPGSSHVVHMPGHIFNRVGRYAEAHKAFEDSRKIDEAYAQRLPDKDPGTNWNYGHNLAFMSYNLAEMGRLKESAAAGGRAGSEGFFANWRAGRWTDLSEERGLYVPFFRGMAAAYDGRAADVDGFLRTLYAGTISRIGRTAQRALETAAHEVEAVIASVEGRHNEAVVAAKKAVAVYKTIEYEEPAIYVRPPYETLAEVLAKAGRIQEGLAAVQEGLTDRPQSGWMLLARLKVRQAEGRPDAIRQAARELLAAWPNADEELLAEPRRLARG